MINSHTPILQQLLSHCCKRIYAATTISHKTALAILVIVVSTTSAAAATATTATPARQTITFTCAITPGSPAYAMTEAFYRNVFDRLNYDFAMIALPVAREAAEITLGNYDGTCGRTSNPAFSQLPNLLRVDQPIAKFSLELIATKTSPAIKNLGDLPAGSSIAYVRGATTLEAKLKKYPQFSSFPASTEANALKMLIANRVDFYLRGKTQSNRVTFESDAKIPLYVVINWDLYYLYPYLHARHSALKTALEAELKQQLQAYPDHYLSLPSAK